MLQLLGARRGRCGRRRLAARAAPAVAAGSAASTAATAGAHAAVLLLLLRLLPALGPPILEPHLIQHIYIQSSQATVVIKSQSARHFYSIRFKSILSAINTASHR